MSLWKDFVTAGLLGTERSTPPALPAALQEAIAPPDESTLAREEEFLSRAGALSLYRRAGWKPSTVTTTLPTSPADPRTSISAVSADHLRTMLGGRCTPALPEWLAEVARRQRQIPAELLPALLSAARNDRSLRTIAMEAGGPRAAWLAELNPLWSFAAIEPPDAWDTGTKEQRVRSLRVLREQSPAEARERLAAVWKTEPAENRSAFLAVLEAGLSMADEPFLESLLDDRSKEVRRVVIDLLSCLPESGFSQRMVARLDALVSAKASKWDIVLPPEPDAAGTRDGLDPKAFGQQKKLGARAVVLVLIVAAVPLSYWESKLQLSPAAILLSASKHEFARALATGWASAALRQRQAVWADALLEEDVKPHEEFLPPGQLFGLLPAETQTKRLIGMIKTGALEKIGSSAWDLCATFLLWQPDEWPVALAREVLQAVRKAIPAGVPWHLREQLLTFMKRIPASLLPDAVTGWPPGDDDALPLIELLTFRHDALQALAKS